MAKEVRFVVIGEPQGKGRPRFVARYNPTLQKAFGQAHTPEKTVLYENLIRTEYEMQCKAYKFPDDAMLDMRILAYYPIPKSGTKKVLEQKRNNQIRPTKKPDCDNVVKVIADSLNQIAYKDDTQIVDCQIRKFFSDEPRVEVIIRQIGETK